MESLGSLLSSDTVKGRFLCQLPVSEVFVVSAVTTSDNVESPSSLLDGHPARSGITVARQFFCLLQQAVYHLRKGRGTLWPRGLQGTVKGFNRRVFLPVLTFLVIRVV